MVNKIATQKYFSYSVAMLLILFGTDDEFLIHNQSYFTNVIISRPSFYLLISILYKLLVYLFT
jgi:hypothetical protein